MGSCPTLGKRQSTTKKIWNNTLNARGETIFEKPAFKDSAKHNRCLIYIDGFYEHHHFNKKTYPFYIERKDKQPLALAGLCSEWYNSETNTHLNTFSIITTQGNSLMGKIHNSPKLTGPRMPLILPEELEDKWLEPYNDQLDQQELQTLIQSYPADKLQAHTVNKIRGKSYLGNAPETTDKVAYEELEF